MNDLEEVGNFSHNKSLKHNAKNPLFFLFTLSTVVSRTAVLL